jgi:hypothetical protein
MTIGNAIRTDPVLKFVRSPYLLIPLLVAVAVAGAVLPRLVGYAANEQKALEQQADQDDGSLCTKYRLAAETERGIECKTALADLRRQHELLLLY